MIRLPDGSIFDDEAADAAYDRAQRQGLVRHYAPALSSHTGRFPESLAGSFKSPPAPSLAGLIFGRVRKRK